MRESHTAKDTFLKIVRFLLNYELICIPSLIIAKVCCQYEFGTYEAVTEMLGLTSNVMIFCWYVPFYIISLLLMLLIYRIMDKGLGISCLVGIVAPILLFSGMKTVADGTIFATLFNNLKHWFPCIAVGYMCNKFNLFSMVKKKIEKIPVIIVLLVAVVGCGVGRYFVSALDFLYCMILVFSLSNMLYRTEKNTVWKDILKKFGLVSTNIWYLHCLFFSSATRELFQPLAYWSKSAFITLMVLLAELYILSFVITRAQTKLLKK